MAGSEEFEAHVEVLRELRKRNKTKREELTKMKEMELWCQKCKKELMQKKTQVASSIKGRCAAVEDMAAGLPSSSRKLFNLLYPQVYNIYQSELLLLELNQQLMVSIATKEEKAMMKALQQESFESSSHHANKNNPLDGDACILQEWFRQISCVKRVVDPDLSPRDSSTEKCRIKQDRVFYWAKYETLPSSHRGVLSFSTRRCGMCIRLRIETPIQTAEGMALSSPDTYTITSDIPLEGLQPCLLQSIQDNQMVHEFVIHTVWRLMENSILPLMWI